VKQAMLQPDSPSKLVKTRPKRALTVVGAVLVGLIVGIALTSQGALSAIIGERFTSDQLNEAESAAYELGRSSGYDLGVDAGYADGYYDGNRTGYSSGKKDGYNSVFDKAGSDDIIAIYYPYRSTNLGRYYWPRNDVC
jgi:hypothetical protein